MAEVQSDLFISEFERVLKGEAMQKKPSRAFIETDWGRKPAGFRVVFG